MIRDYVLETYPFFKSDFVEQEQMEGLGHAIHTAMPTVDDEQVFIILGDTIFDVDLKKVLKS